MATEDRERKEERPRGDENLLRDLIENVPAMVFIALPGTSKVFASRLWRDYAGLSEEETKGISWQGAVHPEDLQRHMKKWRACSASRESFEHETRFRRAADGEYRWFLVRAVPKLDENGRIVKWYGTFTDIEDRKQTEQALRRREAYLADAQKLTHTGSWAWNPRVGELLHYCSDEMYRILGLDPQDGLPSIGKLLERVHPGDRDHGRNSLELQLRKGGKKDAPEYDYRLVMPNAKVKYIHSNRHSVFDSSGTVIEILGIAVDVTERPGRRGSPAQRSLSSGSTESDPHRQLGLIRRDG